MKVVFVDMDDVLCDYSGAHRLRTRLDPARKFPQSVPGFFESLPPLDEAIPSVNQLRCRFDVYVLSAPSVRNAHSYSEKRNWIEKHFGFDFLNKLILSPNKGLLRGDFLIDDHANGRGQEEFQGQLIQFGSDNFPDWNAVMEFMIAKEVS